MRSSVDRGGLGPTASGGLAALTRLGLMGLRACASFLAERRGESARDRALGIRTAAEVGRVALAAFPPPPVGDEARSAGLNGDGLGYEPIRYEHMARIADYLPIAGDDVFLDLGCGRGRAVCVAAARGARKAIGVEIRADLCEAARANASTVADRAAGSVEIVESDAAALPPAVLDEATVIFLFNPFGFRTLKTVVDLLRESLRRRPRRAAVVYAHPVHRWYLDDRPWLIEDPGLRDSHFTMIWRSRPDYDYEAGL